MKNTTWQNINLNVFRLFLFLMIWLILTEGKLSGLYIGVIIAVISTFTVSRYSPKMVVDLSIPGLLLFIAYFIKMSVIGGTDVARRAVTPGKIPLNPGIITYKTDLKNNFSRLFLLHCLGLFPGSMTIDIEGDVFTVHTLDKELNTLENAKELENKIAAMFKEVA